MLYIYKKSFVIIMFGLKYYVNVLYYKIDVGNN